MALEFTKCPISGQLKADGKKGQYWIDDSAWTYLSTVYVNKVGPQIDYDPTPYDLEQAIEEANRLDEEES